MTGKSKWSKKIQRDFVEAYLSPGDYQFPPNTEIPSDWTLKRWIDNWTPIIEEEKRLSKIKQDKAERKHHKPIFPKVKQDENFTIPIKFLSDVEEMAYTWLSAYKKYNYGATIRRRERIHKLIKILEKEVDKK